MTSLAGIVSVLLVAAGLFYTNEANREQQQATRDQLTIAQQGLVTDRFGKAIDQLGQEGTDKLSIRLGGIYALGRLMHDSAPDGQTIIEVLCAFVRTHAPAPVHAVPPPHTSVVPPSSPDVQAAVTVLSRRPNPDRFTGLNFTGSLLSMDRANLTDANLSSVHLVGAELWEANLMNTTLRGANLYAADLSDANLTSANLTGAFLVEASLSSANLSGANLDGANLISADLSGANLTRADLSGANLTRANLSGANLTHANLTYANLTGVDLTGALLTGVRLSGDPATVLRCTRVDWNTQLPAGVAPPRPGAPDNDPACRAKP